MTRPSGWAVPHGWLRPAWPAPPVVEAWSTTRVGGLSRGPYEGMNLADHVGDDPGTVMCNRQLLVSILGLPAQPMWLRQVHGDSVVRLESTRVDRVADASIATTPGRVCTVLTADCLPVLLCDRDGTRVAAVHAGWRGLAAGVLEATVDAMDCSPGKLMAWLGPAIGPAAFEVGPEVHAAFVDADPGAASAFSPSPAGRWLADLWALARLRLARRGIGAVWGGGRCTWGDPGRFYSYRRDGRTGRMASLIWLRP